MKKKVKMILVGVGLIIFVIGCFCLPPYIKYRRALNLYNNKDYASASELFMELGDYYNSKSMYIKSGYDLAKEYVNQGEYDKALSICKNSSLRARVLSMVNKERLIDAVKFINSEKYNEAAKVLSQIETFKYDTEYEPSKIIHAFEKSYIDGNFENAKVFLLAIKDVTEGIEPYEKEIEILQKLQGDWHSSGDGYYTQFRINGWKMQDFDEALNDFRYPRRLLYDEETQSFHTVSKDYIIYIENDNIYKKWVNDGKTHILKCEKKDIIPKINPRIGMTAQEVRGSTWGAPEDINKHTYSWGVKEQWCYSGNRYIYLEDGIVTSISE